MTRDALPAGGPEPLERIEHEAVVLARLERTDHQEDVLRLPEDIDDMLPHVLGSREEVELRAQMEMPDTRQSADASPNLR